MSIEHRRLLLDMFQAAVNAAAPAMCVQVCLPSRAANRGRSQQGRSFDGSRLGSS